MAEKTKTTAAETPAPAREPATPPKSSTGMTSGKRVAIGANVVFQIIILLLIVGMINFVSMRRFARWDFSRSQTFALSSQTKGLLSGIDKPVQAIVYFSGAGVYGQIYPDVIGLLREYEYASGRKVSVEEVNPYRNLTRAKELAEKYRFAGEENIVILDYDGKSKFVNAQDMADMDMGNMMMQQPPRVTAFKGESAITSALLELVEGRTPKLYFTSGHGEAEVREGARPENPDASVVLAEYLKRSNIQFETVQLLDIERIPEDAGGLFVFGPKQDFSEREIELLDQFWRNKGRLYILLNGPAKLPRLHAWLQQNGVTPGPGRLIRTVTVLNLASGQRDTRVQGSGEGRFLPEGATVTRELAGVNAFFFGPTTSLDLDFSKTTTDQIRFTALAQVNKEFWSELDGIAGPAIPQRDPDREKEGPFTVAVALEKGAMEGVKVDTSRMIVVGNSGFLTDGGLTQFEGGLDFALFTVNWLLDRDENLGGGIPPKEKKLTSLTLDEAKLRQLAYAVVLGLPGLVAIFGIVSWVQRRN
jgi:hypothetical protein